MMYPDKFGTPYEKACFENAAYFTAIRGAGAARERREFATFEGAVSACVGDGRTMIYAVTETGNTGHIRNV